MRAYSPCFEAATTLMPGLIAVSEDIPPSATMTPRRRALIEGASALAK
jgi:hypothetical protein